MHRNCLMSLPIFSGSVTSFGEIPPEAEPLDIEPQEAGLPPVAETGTEAGISGNRVRRRPVSPSRGVEHVRVVDTDDEEPAAVPSVPTPTLGPERRQEQIPAPPVAVVSPERPEIFTAEIKPEPRSGSSSSFGRGCLPLHSGEEP